MTTNERINYLEEILMMHIESAKKGFDSIEWRLDLIESQIARLEGSTRQSEKATGQKKASVTLLHSREGV